MTKTETTTRPIIYVVEYRRAGNHNWTRNATSRSLKSATNAMNAEAQADLTTTEWRVVRHMPGGKVVVLGTRNVAP